jgi:hypothetical protein
MQLEPGCSVLMHNKGLAIVGILSDEVDPLVSVMKARALAPCALATRTPRRAHLGDCCKHAPRACVAGALRR